MLNLVPVAQNLRTRRAAQAQPITINLQHFIISKQRQNVLLAFDGIGLLAAAPCSLGLGAIEFIKGIEPLFHGPAAVHLSLRGGKFYAVGIGTISQQPVLDFAGIARSEEHTSELQSHSDLVCRLLLEKKKNKTIEHLLA